MNLPVSGDEFVSLLTFELGSEARDYQHESIEQVDGCYDVREDLRINSYSVASSDKTFWVYIPCAFPASFVCQIDS